MTGSADEALVTQVREAYATSARGWATGPATVYRRLAEALVASSPKPLTGGRVLDLGTGTGVASEVLQAHGAEPIGLDLAEEMLLHQQASRPPGVAGDARSLPFRDGCFDAVVAAFSLNHVPDLGLAVGECERVLRAGGVLLASTFPTGHDHPAKAAVESVLERYGYARPPWYQTFKRRLADLTGDAEGFARTVRATGLVDVEIDHLEVEVGLDRPELAVGWRCNLPHTLAFTAQLDDRTRAQLQRDAVAALPRHLPSTMTMLALRARTA